MKGAWRRTISIALLALFVALLPRQGWVITVQPKRETNPERPNNSPSEIVRPETPEERTADYTEALAYYTRALVIVTALLAVVSAIQIWFLIRADKTAKLTAVAAKQSADVAKAALEQTFAPYLDITVTPKAVISRFPGGNQWRENRLRLQLVKRISTDNCKFLQLGCRPLRCGKFADYEEVKQRRLGIDSVIPEWAVLS